jgi:2-methylcitrate dehydratase
MSSFSRQIARFALGVRYEDLPAEVVHEVKRYLYDSVGCAYGSVKTKDVTALKSILAARKKLP